MHNRRVDNARKRRVLVKGGMKLSISTVSKVLRIFFSLKYKYQSNKPFTNKPGLSTLSLWRAPKSTDHKKARGQLQPGVSSVILAWVSAWALSPRGAHGRGPSSPRRTRLERTKQSQTFYGVMGGICSNTLTAATTLYHECSSKLWSYIQKIIFACVLGVILMLHMLL